MTKSTHDDNLRPDGEDHITFAVRATVREALEDHARTGDPIIIWRDGAIVEVPPEEIPALLASYEEPAEQPPAVRESGATRPASAQR